MSIGDIILVLISGCRVLRGPFGLRQEIRRLQRRSPTAAVPAITAHSGQGKSKHLSKPFGTPVPDGFAFRSYSRTGIRRPRFCGVPEPRRRFVDSWARIPPLRREAFAVPTRGKRVDTTVSTLFEHPFPCNHSLGADVRLRKQERGRQRSLLPRCITPFSISAAMLLHQFRSAESSRPTMIRCL